MKTPDALFRSVLARSLAASAVVLLLLAGPSAWAKLEYNSNQLMMKNAEQVSALVLKKIKKAQDIQSKQDVDDDVGIQAEPEAIEALTQGLRIALSRPDQDGARANLFARVRRELQDLNAFDQALKSLVKESISALKSSSTPVKHQSTYIVLLENLMAELKPEMKTNASFKKAIEDIRDADLKVTDKLISQAMMQSMARPVSPSETAAKILPKK